MVEKDGVVECIVENGKEKRVLIDPKVVELQQYNALPHLHCLQEGWSRGFMRAAETPWLPPVYFGGRCFSGCETTGYDV